MDTITRRKFLQLTGAGLAGLAAPQLTFDEIARAAEQNPLPLGTPIVVVVTLYGGNDGLNTVVPYSDPIYKNSRPDIYLSESDVLPLGDGLGLNGTMTGFQFLWNQKKLAIVRGVGYPHPDRSHFTSMAIWQTASPQEQISSGWIGRWLDSQPHDPLRAIGLGSVLPPLLAGVKSVGSVLPLGGLVVPTGTFARECQQLGQPSPMDTPLHSAAAESMQDLFNISATVSPILKNPAPQPDNLPTAVGGNFGSDSSLSQQLDVVAKLIAAGAPTRVWAASLGGFDTHADEVKAQSALLGSVSNSITRFLGQVHATNRANDVVVLVYSEFGRRVRANASLGTDHGTSGPVFILGNQISGGFYGDEPSLQNLVDGDLAVTTDFRDVYGAILEDLLGTDVGQVIPNWSSKLPLFTSSPAHSDKQGSASDL